MSPDSHVAVYAGFLIGLTFGIVGLLSGFCLMSSLRGYWGQGDGRLVRTYALAMGVAVAASQLLAGEGFVDLAKSIYLQPSFSAPLMLAGGMIFGYGMVLSNGCGSRALILLGRGNLRSLVVVIILGITAQMTLKGLIAPARIAVLQSSQSTPNLISVPALAGTLGLGEIFSRVLAVTVVSGALVIFAFSHAAFRRSVGQIVAGLVVGLLVAAGWYATGYLGADDFNPIPVTSITFVAPVADTVQYTMLSTGLKMNFGVALVPGVVLGSLVTALVTRRFHLEAYNSPRHMLRSVVGAAFMGSGGAMAYGCSVGQGLTGVSTLALASFIAITGIIAGAAIGLRGPLRVDVPASSRDSASPVR